MKPETAGPRASVLDMLFLCTVLLPCVALTALYAFAVRASIALGHWPQPYRPDPKDLEFTLHHAGVHWLLEAAIVSPIALAALLLARGLGRSRSRHVSAFAVTFTVSYALFWLAFLSDPGQVFTWFAD